MNYLYVWGLVGLLALSFWVNALRVTLWYNPFVGTDIDEVVIHYEMREWLLKGTPVESRKLAGYPPFTLIAHYVGHIVMASAAGDWSASYAFEVINLLRWWAIFPSMIASALIYRAMRLYVSAPTAVIVLIVWLLSPLISLERTNAITEPWQLLFVSAALLTFLLAVRDRDMRWSVLSAVFGCLAVVAKYSNFPVLGLSAASAFWILLHDWRKGILTALIQAATIAFTAFVLLVLYDARYLLGVRELGHFFAGGNPAYTNPQSFWEMLYTVSKQFSLPDQFFLLGLLALPVLTWGKMTPSQRYILLIVAVVAVCLGVTTLMYTIFWGLINRYLLSLTVLVAFWLALGLESIGRFTQALSARWLKSSGFRASLHTVPVVIIGALWIVWPAQRWSFLPTGRSQIEHRAVSWIQNRYYDQTLLLFNDIFIQHLWFYFDREFSGYKGKLPPWYLGILTQKTIAEWRDMYIRYVWMYDETHNNLQASHPEYLDNMTLLRRFTPRPGVDLPGREVYIYELIKLEPAHIAFVNGLSIVGFAELSCEYADGVVRVQVHPYWRTREPMTQNLQLFAHVTPADSESVLLQQDQPAATDDYPMPAWEPEDSAVRGRKITIQGTVEASGDLVVRAGLYSLDTLQRVELAEGGNSVELCRVSAGG